MKEHPHLKPNHTPIQSGIDSPGTARWPVYKSALIGAGCFALATIVMAVLHARGVRIAVMDGILAAPELLTFLVYGDDDRFYEYMHTVVMPFGVAVNALIGAIVGGVVHLIYRHFVPRSGTRPTTDAR